MSEPVMKQRPSVDFDEFERSIRDSTRAPRAPVRGHEDDPLAELARLVGTHHDPYGDVFAQESVPAPRQPEPGYPQAPVRPSLDFAAIEAGLRGTIPAHQPASAQGGYAPAAVYAQQTAYRGQAPDPRVAEEAGWYDAPPAPAPAARSRRPVYAMAAVIAVGVVGIGVAFAYKGSNSGPREIALIKAAPGPTKIQPPADDAGTLAMQDASILNKEQQAAPTKLVSREEQPVDLAQTVQNAPRDAGPGITPLYNFGSAADAASVPVPAPPRLTDRGGASSVAGDIEPIRVKTRSYRPDGTPIPNDRPPAAAVASPPSAPKPDKGAVVAKASTPKAATPKSTTRVAAVPKPIVTADRGEDAPADIDAAVDGGARKAPKPTKTAAPKPVQTATAVVGDGAAQSGSTAAAAGGGFAVQVAAPGSEAEAKQTSSRLSQKFAGELGGRRLSFHRAESNGKAVYRVRVSSLSREEATGLCDKLKSSGGTCFVAKN